jgi:hypothetical protein
MLHLKTQAFKLQLLNWQINSLSVASRTDQWCLLRMLRTTRNAQPLTREWAYNLITIINFHQVVNSLLACDLLEVALKLTTLSHLKTLLLYLPLISIVSLHLRVLLIYHTLNNVYSKLSVGMQTHFLACLQVLSKMTQVHAAGHLLSQFLIFNKHLPP